MSANKFLTGLPIIGGLFDDSEEKAQAEIAKNKALYDSLKTPEFQKYAPDKYSVAGEYDPTAAEAHTISEDPALRSQQLSVLSKLSGLANTGLSDVDQQGFERAREEGQQVAKSGTDAAIQNAQARGVSGSGLEFAMREMADQAGAGRAQQAGLDQAAQAAQQRAMYTQAFGNATSGLRTQDMAANSANANILNDFTLRNTQTANDAQRYNLANKQNVSNQNVDLGNQAQQYNNTQQQQTYADQLQKTNGQAGANTASASTYAAQDAANTANRNSNTGLAVAASGLVDPTKKKAAADASGLY